MDQVAHFQREAGAFEAAARQAVASGVTTLVPSCPEWSVTDLVAHLGKVHRYVGWVIRERLREQPDPTGIGFLGLPPDISGWPRPESEPNRVPVPGAMADWFAEGAAALGGLFRETDPGTAVYTWWHEQTVAFWIRMQAIEAAVHRWDLEDALGEAGPVDAELAADAIDQHLTVMTPAGRSRSPAPAGAGERDRFRQSDGPGDWTVVFDGDEVRVETGPGDVELSGTASDLMLFLWRRLPPTRLAVTGDRAALERFFQLAPAI
ncbi:maleylpyruvate isomerase family mycothiol-dependent enzyme [Amycolatopsis suaedae]|uniref:Maleylpyruvate isomerase family mycothiol-dependent enzyme n=1 Tax=Amycolatopsis suaedae TaxID=2510978 RepID=A0A4Q7JEY3_9PSEU|nr:maleylpyruvate isomerase family mycothiol-dependent enzyme [Amycolatopsis suaedae]RZQ66047.1 maleylpyruvate isomerase family mycothiol-dependent enzyme [Amycolatopsis suaedae]